MSTIQTAATVIPFQKSRTCEHLQHALQDKLDARCLYLDAARRLEADDLHVIAYAFRFSAAQESEHAAILRGLLTARGGSLPPAEEAPPLLNSAIELLRAAAERERTIWAEHLPCFADAAADEGYPRIAAALRRIAETDQLHTRRFAQYMDALTSGRLLSARQPVSWVCLRCGQLHTGCEPPECCPGCSGGMGHFIRTSFYPFSVED